MGTVGSGAGYCIEFFLFGSLIGEAPWSSGYGQSIMGQNLAYPSKT